VKVRDAGAARRYARALLDVALARKDDRLRPDLERLAALYTAHADLRHALLHPALPAEKKRALVTALWTQPTSRAGAAVEGKPSELLLRLVDLLVTRARVELLPLIAQHYGRLWNAQRGVVEAESVSARALGEDEARGVSAAASRVTGKQVELKQRVDPSLTGGLLLRMEGRIYDGSVRARLRALRERLAGEDRR
jgi:F-type H+-transporting ATPase subunit delta